MARMLPGKKRIFYRIFRVSRRYAWLVLIISIIISGAGVYYVWDLPIRGSFLDLLPQNDPLIDEYRYTEESLLQSDYLALLVSLDSPTELTRKEGAKRLLDAAKKISEELSKDPEFIEVSYEQEIAPEIPDQYLVLYRLDKDELANIESSVASAQAAISGSQRTTPQLTTDLGTAYRLLNEAFTQAIYGGDAAASDVEIMGDLEAQLASITSLNKGVIATIDNLDSFSTVTSDIRDIEKVFAPSQEESVRAPEPYFSSDRTKLLINVRPRLPSETGVTYSSEVMTKLHEGLSNVQLQEYGVSVGVTGTYAFNTETNSVINADMLRSTIISSIGVVVIIFLAFGSLFYSLIALIPLLISVVLTMAWAKFVVDGFNLVTTFLPALVLGLGIDYSIHFISRYAEERSKGTSFNKALHVTVEKKGEAAFVGAATTGIVFLGLLLSRSRALFEMGAITGVGVMLSFLTTLFILPSLITLFHFLFRFHHHREGVLNYTVHMTRFFQFITGRARAIFVIVLILTFFVAFQAAQTNFVFSSQDMIPNVESQQVLSEVLEAFGEESTNIGDYYTFFANDESELSNITSHLQKSDLVKRVDSALSLLPVNLAEQRDVLDQLDIGLYIDQLDIIDVSLDTRASAQTQIRTLVAQFGLLQYLAGMNGEMDISITANLVQSQLKQVRESLNAIDVDVIQQEIAVLKQELIELDENLAEVKELPPAKTLLRDILMALPEGIRANYLAPDGSYIIQARMVGSIYKRENLKQFNSYASSFADRFFGMPLVAGKLENYMRRDFFVSTAFALGMIMIMLWRSMGGWIRALITGFPLVLGYAWMLGGMRLLEIDFNFVNITISPLLIGIGVDSGIHIMHRYLEERGLSHDGAVERAGRTSAVAVLVTSLTTMLVFASLLIARTPGLRLLGVSALLGIGFTLLFSVVFLIAVLQIYGEKRL